MSCPDGYSEVSDSETYYVEIKEHTTLGFTLFLWRHEIDWESSYCMESCSNCMGDISDTSIDDYDINSYSVETDVTWSYDGNVSSDVDHDEDATVPTVTSFRQDLYTGANIFGVPTGKANPFSEFEVDAWGNRTLIDYDSGL